MYLILRKTAETCNKAVMRITHAVNGSKEGYSLVSHIYLEVCSSLTLMHERHTNMDDPVKLRNMISEVIFNKL